MKVFISWSGQLSHRVAIVFRDWLPSVIQSLIPYVSSEDIEKGARWSLELTQEIAKSGYGIICVTQENVGKPWLNFEAGALSRSIEKTTEHPFSSAVSPFLFDLQSSELEGPLTQFQYVKNEHDEILKLVSSINSKHEAPLSDDKVGRAFEKWWPDLRDALAKIAEDGVVAKRATAATKTPEEILSELLDLVRGQQRNMVSKDEFIAVFKSLDASIESLRSNGVPSWAFGGLTRTAAVKPPNMVFGDPLFVQPNVFASSLTGSAVRGVEQATAESVMYGEAQELSTESSRGNASAATASERDDARGGSD